MKKNKDNYKFKIYMVGGFAGYANWFPFPEDAIITGNPEEANIAWWIGGADLDPKLYNDKEGKHSYVSVHTSREYKSAWDFFKKRNVFKIGTCLGHQALCCFSFDKVKLVQDMQHPGFHSVITRDGTELGSNSLHHQQVILHEPLTGLKEGKDYELLSYCNKLSPYHLNGDDQDYEFPDDYKEPEAVWIPETKSFCVQNHPEMMGRDTPLVRYYQDVLIEKLKDFKVA